MQPKPSHRRRGQEVDQALIDANQRLTPEERLNAFLIHSRLLMDLYNAGRCARESRPGKER